MNMNDTFAPEKPEEFINAKITLREADLICQLRRYPFGKVVVFKANNIIIRIEPNESIKIEENPESAEELA